MSKKSSIFALIGLAYGLAWIIWFGLWLCGIKLGEPVSQISSIAAMWMPALAFFILKKVRPDQIEMKATFSLNLKGRWYYYLLALWLPAVLSVLGAGLYYLVFSKQFSLGFESLRTILDRIGASQTNVSVKLVVCVQILSALTYGPFLNSLLAVGEEIGWRGYLYPALREQFSAVQAHLLIGLIWSLWHLPINLQGYNYGLTYVGYPWLGVLAMFVFCFSLGVLLSWVMEKTGSILAPALLHGAVNAIAGLGFLFQLPTEKVLALRILGPSPAGFLAVLPFLFLALAILQKERKSRHEFCEYL
ncbi:CPBP family intramembrane glutamic endopeptidase [Streptococcus intermedius]|uniref:CPBP family intramembrane metalloprotease n=1 Tax=Streptococcus intermedius TaxID=1338 RepID=A0A930WFX5_STRIT|nr:CPBP family intramembrane glutamic endopeptidase [Streptococcus intermedius]AGU78405.1 hypothetical protein SII_1230 [Streptococcus intermedius C270]MBF1713197.1 CPBP family intramembrane metalloprotease [Streptococcus intermedius]